MEFNCSGCYWNGKFNMILGEGWGILWRWRRSSGHSIRLKGGKTVFSCDAVDSKERLAKTVFATFEDECSLINS